MANENTKPVVIRTQVYLSDPDYFCNKSWTMSYNLNTKSWISYHSYIPNFYIGENNFFYSGLNGCCDDGVAGGFQAIAGVIDKTPPLTTTTTTFYPSPSTTTTTTTLNCILNGRMYQTDCILDGNAIITVYPTTTTTICQRPSNLLTSFSFIKGYTLGIDPEVIFINSIEEACTAVPSIEYISSLSNIDGSTLDTFAGFSNTTTAELQLNNIVYYGDSTDCTFVPDGWYFAYSPIPLIYVYHISGGVIIEITTCDCSTTTSTTTAVPEVSECCGILLSSVNDIYYLDKITNIVSQLNVSGYVSSLGTAMTSNYLWSIDTDIQQWDINLSPFSATYNTSISLPIGFSTGKGLVAKNSSILIAINDLVPQYVVELDITNGVTSVMTTMFSLQTNRISTGNMLYTLDEKLIVINQDFAFGDYYITQYDYYTGVVEVDINIGSIAVTSLFECDCDIYVTDIYGNLYVIIKMLPYTLLDLDYKINITTLNFATQVMSCVVNSITQDTPTTTTTTTI